MKTGSMNKAAVILFRVLEITPGMKSTTVPVYERKVRLFRVSKPYTDPP